MNVELLFVGLIVASFAIGVACTAVFYWLLMRLVQTEHMRKLGQKGQDNKQAAENELLAMIQTFVAKVQEARAENPTEWQKKLPAIGIQTGLEHPFGALKFGKELRKLIEQFRGD